MEMKMPRIQVLVIAAMVLVACGDAENTTPVSTESEAGAQPGIITPDIAPPPAEGYVAYSGASIWDGSGAPVQTGKSLVVQNGRVVGIFSALPEGTETIDLQGKWIVPGFVNAHGHVSGRWAKDSVTNSLDRIRGDLSLYARYGVTSVVSLGGAGGEAFEVRNAHENADLKHARIRLSGEVVAGNAPEEATAIAKANVRIGADWIKLRVDDNLGNGTKMPWDVIAAAMTVADNAGLPVATHIFYMDDALRLLDMGTDLIAHSVRDQKVTAAFTDAMLESGVCYVPTLTREVSTFVYESRPDFFDDPFFLEGAKQSEIERVSDPAFMAGVASSPTAAGYKLALQQAKENLKIVADAGVPIAFGTDTGPGGRFLGYFEHMEFDLMADSGLTPEQILLSATSVAADCVDLDDVGILAAGRWADFVVLDENPLEDIQATHSINKVFVAGNELNRD
jgi:imidazolonepropionase-like amidohydrolase